MKKWRKKNKLLKFKKWISFKSRPKPKNPKSNWKFYNLARPKKNLAAQDNSWGTPNKSFILRSHIVHHSLCARVYALHSFTVHKCSPNSIQHALTMLWPFLIFIGKLLMTISSLKPCIIFNPQMRKPNYLDLCDYKHVNL